MCNLAVDSGPCRGAFRKYYYEPGLHACREFIYGGCDGNANRFSTISECESICIHHEEPVPPGNDTSVLNLCAYIFIPLSLFSFPLKQYFQTVNFSNHIFVEFLY